MYAGSSKIDITPKTSVAMDGMIREHGSTGVHDPIFARVIVAGNSKNPEENYVLISVDICGIPTDDCTRIRNEVRKTTGIPSNQVIVSATHTHSGPAAHGFFDAKETEYSDNLIVSIGKCAKEVFDSIVPALFASASGVEDTISHYRRLMSKSGKVLMNWEPFDPEDIVGPLGKVDTEVGVLRFTAQESGKPIAVLFNHAGHPNIMSGDNYLISGDYVGFTENRLENELGCICAFFNGAQGTMDIDGLKDRDWDGVERAGNALADAVINTLSTLSKGEEVSIFSENISFTVPVRIITDELYAWAKDVWEKCGGTITPMADGVGDDYKAKLYIDLHESDKKEKHLETTCFVIGDTALVTFPGELYTEIGQEIKQRSPFKKTYVLGLSNGYEGYFPTEKAIAEGGYAEDTRKVEGVSEVIVLREYESLLNNAFEKSDLQK